MQTNIDQPAVLHFAHGAHASAFERNILYVPKLLPGFVAWTTAFDYGDHSIGLSFKETLKEPNLTYTPPRLELGEAVGAPVSYCSVECGSQTEQSYRVYMRSTDGGKTFAETGRCQLEQGSFCNIGFPDGRILGLDVPRINAEGTGWCDFIDVRESRDGGSTWHNLTHLLPGTAPYLWRVRRLRDGTVLVLASLYGTPWGIGRERATRNTMLPGETYLTKIQTFFMTTRDGVHFTGPHYVLPGIGAHEYDVAECADGRLLFIAGDVQATPVARQFVTRQGDSFLNGTMLNIHRGAPPMPKEQPQGGFVPESLVMLPNDVLIGSRRGKPYTCSVDYGENWFEVDSLPQSLYQPFMLALPSGKIANFGHFGGDLAFGQEDMYIGADVFALHCALPSACTLTLRRLLSDDHSHFINRYRAALQSGGKPVAHQMLCFRIQPSWNADDSYCTASQEQASLQFCCETDENGIADCDASFLDRHAEIHYYYNIDVVFRPQPAAPLQPAEGPCLCEAALTPYRSCRYPYEAYFAGGTLYLSPKLLTDFPTAMQSLTALCGRQDAAVAADALPEALAKRLLACGVLLKDQSGLRWYRSIHAPCPLHQVLPMAEGDLYV
ncbi:MAG: sialidase family protein [Clostridia bacterium]